MAIPKNTDPQFKIRLPNDLLQSLAETATANNRSTNAEIVARLQAEGETLRDRFSMAALTGMLACGSTPGGIPMKAGGWDYSFAAYKLADDMLAERQKGGAA